MEKRAFEEIALDAPNYFKCIKKATKKQASNAVNGITRTVHVRDNTRSDN